MTPALHHPIPLETRVRFAKQWSSGDPEKAGYHYGTLVGIASMHIIFHYIVLLDEPIDTAEGRIRAASIPGVVLESEDGSHDWRLEDPPLRSGA